MCGEKRRLSTPILGDAVKKAKSKYGKSTKFIVKLLSKGLSYGRLKFRILIDAGNIFFVKQRRLS